MTQWQVLTAPIEGSTERNLLFLALIRYTNADGDDGYEGDILKVGLKSSIVAYLMRYGQGDFVRVRHHIISSRGSWSKDSDDAYGKAWTEVSHLLEAWTDPDIDWSASVCAGT
ncbi:MAG TPA: hypothetical protein VLF21_01335 [Candidatus Saccharimonadales bacterium]|nr:hypothetical protein [Candidatus Saccharimonadales bacterium]